jgi:Zn-dependent protease with chaperone function
VFLGICVALAGSVAAAQLLRATADRLATKAAAFALALGALLTASIWVLGLGLLAAATAGRVQAVARFGRWSASLVAARAPVPPVVGFLGLVALGAAVVLLTVAIYRLLQEGRRLRRLHVLTGGRRCGELSIIEGATPAAMALPGWRGRGRIVLTSAMLRLLDPAERRVLLAHERSHVRNFHWGFRLATRISAAVLPTNRPLVRQCDQALERWADESAAAVVGDRRVVASAVAKAALGNTSHPSALLSHMAAGDTVHRIEALLESPRPSRWGPTLAPIALVVMALTAVLLASTYLEDVFELAKQL